MSLQDGLQIVIQAPDPRGMSCTGYVQAPVDTPVYVAIVPASPSDAGAAAVAVQLGASLKAHVDALSGAIRRHHPPCNGSGLGACHALDVPECRAVFVPVFDSVATATAFSVPAQWKDHPGLTVVPVVTTSVSPGALPPSLAKINVLRWRPGDPMVPLRILAAAGIGSQRPRVFISYVRRDSQQVADQLFDRLHREGFEVFLDRFSIRPGVDFATKLHEELSRKGMVVVLETAGIRSSRWTRLEIDFARAHRLGLVAVSLPGGQAVAGIDADRRHSVATLDGKRRLPARRLRELVAWLVGEHTRAEHRRGAYLRETLSDALSLRGVRRQAFVSPQVLVAENSKGRRFAVRLSNVPAELDDFHVAGSQAARPSRPSDVYVVAPGRFVDWRQRVPLDWLQQVSGVQLRDESEIDQLATEVA